MYKIFTAAKYKIVHHVNQALRAHTLFKSDVDYLVKEGEVIIVDEFTGRVYPDVVTVMAASGTGSERKSKN